MTQKLRRESAERRLEMAQLYQRLFLTEIGQLVLEDLAKFGHADETCINTKQDGSVCPFQTMRASGRREVILMIQQRIDTDISALHEFTARQSNRHDDQ